MLKHLSTKCPWVRPHVYTRVHRPQAPTHTPKVQRASPYRCTYECTGHTGHNMHTYTKGVEGKSIYVHTLVHRTGAVTQNTTNREAPSVLICITRFIAAANARHPRCRATQARLASRLRSSSTLVLAGCGRNSPGCGQRSQFVGRRQKSREDLDQKPISSPNPHQWCSPRAQDERKRVQLSSSTG